MEDKLRFQARRRSSDTSLVDDWLTLLGVGHTVGYSLKREKEMPFKTWFGLSRLLEEYGVTSAAYQLPDKSEIRSVPPPFIAHTGGAEGGNVIVTSIDNEAVEYLSLGVVKRAPLDTFIDAWDGNVFMSRPESGAAEPELGLHRRLDFFTRAKKWVLLFCAVVLVVYAFVINGLYRHIAAYFVAAIDIGGLYVTYLLVQKSLRIHNPKADRFCGVLQEGGCDDILATSASKFFGLFGWSEVGFAYFSVSLLSLLMFPGSLPALALCNLCCLPFTAWSIWYQRFRAKRWCTLCVTVQCSLWLLFFSYLAGGWVKECLTGWQDAIVLGFAYLATMLLINALMPLANREENSTSKSDRI
ncbi:MAG: hypothetical protein K2M37_01315 [Muribaculaceae bacterium]|nr:hypothetical protein [Muribaculaceae bacterium]